MKSINASGHKMGWRPSAAAGRLARRGDLPEDMIFNVNYLGGDYPTFNLNFSRPGGQVIAQYYDFIRLGHEGYGGCTGAAHETCALSGQGDRRARACSRSSTAASPAGSAAVTWS